MPKHTGASYRSKETKYAETVDQKPWNAHYERPALVSLLPPLQNTKVLDVGCGSGWYTEHLISKGATVTAFDISAEFVKLTKARTEGQAEVVQADLCEPLDFASAQQYDVVISPLVMHYIKAWQPVFAELNRVLKPKGTLIFSTHHPFMDWKLFDRENYFEQELLEDEWDGLGKMTFYRRPLTAICEALYATGFVIERLLEPQPTKAFQRANAEAYERLSKNPWFLFFRARKEG